MSTSCRRSVSYTHLDVYKRQGSITGLDGSGFSGISLAGSLASVFGTAVNASVGALCALGQIAGIWVGGGCLVPWGLISAAAICGVCLLYTSM